MTLEEAKKQIRPVDQEGLRCTEKMGQHSKAPSFTWKNGKDRDTDRGYYRFRGCASG